jgi:hypothetical protein
MDPDIALSDALEQAVAETFSGMAFLDALPTEPCGFDRTDRRFVVEVRAAGIHRIVLILPLPVCRTIVENIHACSMDELSASDVDDCLLETLNVLAGTFGRFYWGDVSRYKLTLPRDAAGLPDEPPERGSDTYWFDAEGQPFAVYAAEA